MKGGASGGAAAPPEVGVEVSFASLNGESAPSGVRALQQHQQHQRGGGYGDIGPSGRYKGGGLPTPDHPLCNNLSKSLGF